MQAKHSGALTKPTLLQVMEGVPQHIISLQALQSTEGVKLVDLLTDAAPVFPSKGEMRKMTQQEASRSTKRKPPDPYATVTVSDLLNGKYLLVQRGKKNYFLLIAQ